ISPENKREFPPRIVFAPLVSLDAYANLLRNSGAVPPEVIENKITSIRKQQVTSLFFVPGGANLQGDHIALLDDLHSLPLKIFLDEQEKSKLFTLGQMGFYLFLLKLSIHFCRFREGIARDKG